MDRGRVVEEGPHDELMARQGAYWRLYEAQQRQVEQEERGDGTGDALSHARHANVPARLDSHAAHPAGNS